MGDDESVLKEQAQAIYSLPVPGNYTITTSGSIPAGMVGVDYKMPEPEIVRAEITVIERGREDRKITYYSNSYKHYNKRQRMHEILSNVAHQKVLVDEITGTVHYLLDADTIKIDSIDVQFDKDLNEILNG